MGRFISFTKPISLPNSVEIGEDEILEGATLDVGAPDRTPGLGVQPGFEKKLSLCFLL